MSTTVAAAVAIPAWIKLCSNTAPLAAIVVFMAPSPTIQQIQRDKTVGNLPLLPYSSMIANCSLWFTYGVLRKQQKVWLPNLVGLLLGIYYFLRFSKYAPPKSPTLPGSIRQHLQVTFGVAGLTLGWIMLCYMTIKRKNKWSEYAATTIGNVAVFFCLLMFASPLSALRSVIATRSAASIPLPFTMATILNCFLWSVAGLGEFKDFNIYFPNLLGLTFGLIQVALKIVFGDGDGSERGLHSSTRTKDEAEMELVM